ncbi:hypothetical protein NITGR_430022 [Nitrospina gracilis 3/211]|uniref:Uncharacterized protein n=1 Tax=Nitrospina gracilis (strain 3/211) TaxID=1266370 RepID=M1YZD5_NITG3|nr:hypothetical protein [Nitrospina gracilis]CCQ90855.1 hypothetical protein NITGR_430022 [Nitrospina gracilis 3/211]
MSKDFDIEKGIFGKKMVVKGKWKDKNKIVLIEQNVKELELNSGKGWKDRRVDFLKNLDFLQSLTIRGIGEPIEDISGIHYLNQLKYLDVETYCKTKIDFFCFPKLEECVFEWRPKSESLFGCTKLKKLWINSYKNETQRTLKH